MFVSSKTYAAAATQVAVFLAFTARQTSPSCCVWIERREPRPDQGRICFDRSLFLLSVWSTLEFGFPKLAHLIHVLNFCRWRETNTAWMLKAKTCWALWFVALVYSLVCSVYRNINQLSFSFSFSQTTHGVRGREATSNSICAVEVQLFSSLNICC